MAFEYLGYELETMNAREHSGFLMERGSMRQVDDPFDFDPEEFRKLYRLSPDLCRFLIERLNEQLRGSRVTAISSEKLVLAALRFFATGCFQRPVGEQWGISMSQPSISRAIHKVTDSINMTMFQQYIRFPMTTVERQAAKSSFLSAAAPFNGAMGAIDCTHVSILAPALHEEAYVNHHGYHSINVQMICDPKLKILNVNARFPGARHDAYIWNASAARRVMSRAFENGDRHAFLIGDAGYPLEPWLMTPLPNSDEGTPEYRYNSAFCKARNPIERLFGVMKATWRCLSRQRVLMYDPGFAGRIVNACSVLHNLRLREVNYDENVILEPDVSESGLEIPTFLDLPSQLSTSSIAKRIQNKIISNYYSN